MTLYPVFLDLAGERVLVVGGGAVGLRRAQGLAGAGARVTVVAPAVLPEFEDVNVAVIRRGFEPADLRDMRLAFACADDEEINDAVTREAKAAGVWVSRASRPETGNLRLGASLERGGTQVAVSTGADLPFLSQALRDKLAAALPGELPIEAWAARRAAALDLPRGQRELVLSTLKAEIRKAVGV